VPWLCSLVTGFNPTVIPVGFVVDKVSPKQDFLKYFFFHLSITFHQKSIHINAFALL
jgi:hypothetical protein